MTIRDLIKQAYDGDDRALMAIVKLAGNNIEKAVRIWIDNEEEDVLQIIAIKTLSGEPLTLEETALVMARGDTELSKEIITNIKNQS